MNRVKQPHRFSLNLTKVVGVVATAICSRGVLNKDVFCVGDLFVEW